MHIYVRCLHGGASKTLTLTVEICDTIADLKAKIEDMEGIHPSVQSFTYACDLLEDRRALADYNIRNNSSLDMLTMLAGSPYIYVKTPNGNTIRVVCKGLDTVRKVKAKVEEKEGIPFDKHALFFAGKQLEDTHTLYHYGIIDGSSLRLVQLSDAGQTTPSSKANPNISEAELKVCAIRQTKATEDMSEVISEVRPGASSSVGTELEDLKHQMATDCCKRKELEATVSKLTHKNKVVSARCASYERKLAALETEIRKLKQQLIQGFENYPSAEQGQAFLEGEKAKWLKSVEFLDHLTEGALQYFDYGFDSCRKQAEQQGFVGQLNKDTALEEAPELKVCGFNDMP